MKLTEQDSEDTPLPRRSFLGALGLCMAPVGTFQIIQDSLAGTLRDPVAAGRSRTPTDPKENDAEIQAIEQRLACSCGCTLDVFTCRTTDFSCTYSPGLHREIVALRDRGKTAREILDEFVVKYGEKALMAPKPQGFNLWGYLLPGALIISAAAALVTVLRRREAVASAPGSAQPLGVQQVSASPEELERLRRALVEIEN